MADFWRRRAAADLSDYWNAVTDGQTWPDRAATEIDRTLLDTIARIQEGRQRYVPDPAFVDRLETTLMSANAISIAVKPPPPVRRVPRTAWLPGTEQELPRRWGLATLSTVALIAFVLVAFFFILRGTDQPAVVPGTPDAATPTSDPAPTASVEPVNMYRGGLERTGVMPGPAPAGRPGVLWRAETGSVVKGPVVVGNGLVYTGTDDGSVHAFDMTSGAEVWKLTGNTTIESPSIVLDGATAYVAGYDGMVLAVDAATGAELWRTDPALNVSRKVAFDEETQTLYVGGLEPVSYAFDSSTGQLRWQTDIQAPQASVASIVVGDTLYFGVIDGLLYALNTADGTIRWTYDSTLDGFGSLTFANGTLFAPAGPAEDPAFVAVDAATGAERWRTTSDSAPYSAGAVLDGNVIFGTELGEVMSVSQTDGAVGWTFATGTGAPIWGPPGIVGDEIYVVDVEGSLYALDAATGGERWWVKLDSGINYNPAVTGGVMYVGTWSGSVYALAEGGTDPALLAATPVATPIASPATSTVLTTTFLWQAGGTDSPLGRPDGIAVAPDGSIWVVDAIDHELHVFEADGTTRQVIALNDAGAGAFNFTLPNGESYASIAVDADGNAHVLDTGNFRVAKFDAAGQFVTELSYRGEAGTPLYSDEVAVGPDGSLYVQDFDTRSVLRFTANGDQVAVIGQPESVDERLTGPVQIGIDAEGNIYVADRASDFAEVKVYAPDGTFLRRFGSGDLELAIDVAVDANGIAYVTDERANQIKVFDSNGSLIGSIGERGTGPGQFTGIASVAVDANGNLYVVDFEGRQVEAFQVTWNSPAEAASPEASPDAVTTDEVELLWETSGGDGGLGTMALAPNGTIWVADVVNHGFQIFDAEGTFLESWTGTGEGEFRFMRANGDAFNAIAFAPDGSFFVLDAGGRRIQAFAADRTFLRSIGGPGREPGLFLDPIDVAIDPAGNLAVLDDNRWDIQTFAPDGTLIATAPLQSAGTGKYEMNSLAIDAEGNFYVAELSEDFPKARIVEKFDPKGNLLQQFGAEPGPGQLIDHPGGIAVDAAGNVYVTEFEANPRVMVFTPDGTYLTEFGGPGSEAFEFTSPGDVLLDGEGNIYVTDGFQNRLVKLRLPQAIVPATSGVATSAPETAGGVERLWETTGGDGGFAGPGAVEIAPDGAIWVADAGNARFQIFDADGAFLESWTGTGDGQFGLVQSDGDPFGAVSFAADGSFYVLDPGARHVLAFSADRTYLRSIGEPGRDPGQFVEPVGIAVDAAGNVAILDDVRGDIQTFAPDGTLIATAQVQSTSTGAHSMNLMIVDGDGNFFVAECPECPRGSAGPGVVEKFDAEGNLLQQFGLGPGAGAFGDQPVGIEIDAAGNVYVTEIGANPRIVVFSPDGTYLMEIGGTEASTVAFDVPFDVAVDDGGNIYVTDMVQNRLVKLRLPYSLTSATPAP